MMTPDVSARLRALRFPLIVGVVFIHAYTTQVALGGGQHAGTDQVSFSAFFIRNLVSQGIARIAVPMFFLMSAFLFFQGYRGTWSDYRQKLQRRIRTLLVPFLIWNAATLLLYAVGESLASTQVYFANKYWPAVRDFTLLDYGNALLGLTTKYPMSYQFWFLRDLMALMILAPLFYFCLRRRPMAIVLLLALLFFWVSNKWWPMVWPSQEATLFFAAGAYLAIADADVCALDRWKVVLGPVFIVLLVVSAATGGMGSFMYVHRAMVLSGIPFLWWLTHAAIQNSSIRTWLFRLSASAFFVYAAQEPPLSILRKTAFRLLSPTSSAVQIGLYFAIPLTLIAALVVLSELLTAWLPGFMSIITGADTKRPLPAPVKAARASEAGSLSK